MAEERKRLEIELAAPSEAFTRAFQEARVKAVASLKQIEAAQKEAAGQGQAYGRWSSPWNGPWSRG